jgi:histidinol dehydrogenase
MERDLHNAITSAHKQNIPIKDICFSGNGEPTLSPAFADALKLAESIRAQTAPDSKLVIITNGTGLLQPQVFSVLKDAALNPSLDIWLKVDAGTQNWYQKMNRCALSYEKLIEKIKEFTSCTAVTIQTMLCVIDGQPPPDAEAWESLVCQLAANGRVRKVQIYGKARCAPEDPKASALPVDYLEKRASSLRDSFAEKNITTPIEIYP